MTTDKKNHLVSKDNGLLEAKYRLSVQEQRLMAIMVSDIKPDDKDFKTYKYKVKDIVEWLGTSGENYYSELNKITTKLLSRVISIYNKDENKLFKTSWLSSSTYDLNRGLIELRFDPGLKPYLLQLQNCFTQYALQNVLELKSKYAFRLYELCKQYQSIGKRKFQIDELRELLGLEKGELRRWSDFKRKVLDIAQREINKHTDIKIRYEFEKIARKFEYITIYVSINTKAEIEAEKAKNERYNYLLNLIKNEKDRKKKTIQTAVIKWLKREGFEYVERNILYANEKAEKNYRAYLIKALQNDWAMAWIEDTEEERERQAEWREKKEKTEQYRKYIENIRESARKRALEIISGYSKDEYALKFEETKKKMGGLGMFGDIEAVKERMTYDKMKELVERAIEKKMIPEHIGRDVLKFNI